MSEWANTFAVLSAESSADAGKFTSYKFQDGFMDAVSDPTVKKVTLMKSAQVGYTRILCHIVGYFIHQDPAPLLIIQPRNSDATGFSRDEIAPMLRDTPVLAAITGDPNAKNSGQRLEKRSFKNSASVAFIGAESPDNFRRIKARIVCFDEVDGYDEMGAGNEGDQIALGTMRAASFWNRKIILGSTPTRKGASRIETSWNESDQRRYHVPCPHCGAKQVLKWENLQWEKTETGEHLPETAHFRCVANGCRIEEHDKPGMIDAGEWVAEKPFEGHAGFHIWAAYSLFESAQWKYLAKEWLDVYKDQKRKKAFFNLMLGETYEDAEEVTDPGLLKERAEPYSWETLPSEAKLVTFGADTQDDRLEVTFVAHGAHGETWVARHEVIYGDPSKQYLWNELDKLLLEPCVTDEGRVLLAQAGCVDVGGHHTAIAMKFCQDRKRRRIYGIIGRGNTNERHPRMIWPKTASRGRNSSDKPITVGVDTAKDDLSSRLAIIPALTVPTPRAIHFPMVGLTGDYYEQLTSEHAVLKREGSVVKRSWDVKTPGSRNEAWDCLVYAMAARLSLPIKLEKSPHRVRKDKTEEQAIAEAVASTEERIVDAVAEERAAVMAAPTVDPAPQEKPPPKKKRERAKWAAYR
ncbi:MAG: phage terminase large subunit family protein [Cypionkella sp.]